MSQFWTETGREFQTDGAVVLKERLPKEVRLNGRAFQFQQKSFDSIIATESIFRFDSPIW